MKKFLLLLIATSLFAVSCGKKAEEIKDAAQAVNKLAEAGNKMEEYQKKAEAKIAERKKRGDVKSIHFTELQKLLPAAPAGFKAEEPQGATTQMGEFSLSQSSVVFVKEGPEGKNVRIKVELTDYNESYQIYQGLAVWAAADFSVENTEGYEKNYNTGLNDVFSHEKWEKKNKHGYLYTGVSYRFFINIDGENIESNDILKDLLKKIDMNKLAAM